MKHTAKLRWILGLTLVTAFVSTITASLTWFDNRINWKPSITGSSAAAYFAYGDGSQDHPYGIKTPRHLYNLAWLQYLGQFNGNNKKAPVYFEIDKKVRDVDMSTIGAIPPIGTVEHPFIGVFNGNGKTIKNLNISNAYGDFKSTPYSVNSGNYSNKPQNIIGMFGVVGDSSQKTNPNVSVYDFYLENPVINSKKGEALAGVVAGYVNAKVYSIGVISPKMSFSTSTSCLGSKSGLTGKTFDTVSDYSLVGFCEDNYKSTISSSVTKMTKSSTKNLMVPPGVTSSGSGDDHGWGGSIDMYSLYNRLTTQKGKSTPIQYVTKINASDSQVSSMANVQINSWQNVSVDPYPDFVYPKYEQNSYDDPNFYFGFNQYEKKDVNDKQTTSIAYINSPYSKDINVIELTGKATRYIENGKTIHLDSSQDASKKEKSISLFYEKKGDTNVYLKVSLSNGSPVMGTTDDSKLASLMYLTKSTINDPDYTISVNLNGSDYFMNTITDTEGNITGIEFETASSKSPTKWFYNLTYNAFSPRSDPSSFFSIDSSFTTWGLQSTGFSYQLKDARGYNFTNTPKDSTSFISAEKDSEISNWFLVDGKVYLIEKDEKENNAGYLIYDSNKGLKIGAKISTKPFTYLRDNNKVYIYFIKDNALHFPKYNETSKKWVDYTISNAFDTKAPTVDQIKAALTNTNNKVTVFTYTPSKGVPFLFGSSDDSSSSDMTVNSEFETPDTFIPLQVDSNYNTLEKNTGYLVGGTDYYRDYAGDIRVSRYEQKDDTRNISNSFNQDSKTLTTVYTINPDGTTVNSNGSPDTFSSFSKYTSAKEQMEEVLKQDNGLYGLHFMNGEIGKRRDGTYVSIPSAKINENSYSDYQVPDDCIDFSLQEEGIINFFGGTYYDANNCFFSLYKVERYADNQISSLKKIKAIYSADKGIYWPGETTTVKVNTNPSYSFADQNESKIKIHFDGEDVPTWKIKGSQSTVNDCPGEKVFDVDNQLGLHTDSDGKVLGFEKNNAVYYFEIPVPAGEYALGSVNDSLANGAYLMYLDLRINAKVNPTVNRTIISEYMTHTLNTYTTFLGVNIISAGTSDKDNFNSYCITIKSGATGDVTFSMDTSENGLVKTSAPITGTDSTISWLTLKFKKNDGTITGKFNNIDDGNIQSEDAYLEKFEKTVTETKRVTYYDYDSAAKKTNAVEVTSTSINPGDWTTSVSYYTTDENGNFVPTEHLKFASSETTSTPFTEEEIKTLAIKSTDYGNKDLYSFEMESKELGKITVSFKSTVELNDGYYRIIAYDFTISGETISDQTTVSVTSIKRNEDGTTTYTLKINDTEITNQTSIEVTIGSSANQ